jgi:hypothetical protein
MNWYKQSQQESSWKITQMVSALGMSAILSLLAISGMNMPALAEKYQENPQQVTQQVQQVAEETEAQHLQEIRFQEDAQRLAEPDVEEQKPSIADIDLNKIWQIESTSGQNPKMHKPNSSGALGHFQFLEKTWNEMVGKMGKNWDWKTGSLDYDKSKLVADYYFNKRIPSMLNYFKIPDSIKTRIACYSWGIGKLNNAYKEYGENWETVAPQETTEYFVKYGVE